MSTQDVLILYKGKASELQLGIVKAGQDSVAAALAFVAAAAIFAMIGFSAVRDHALPWTLILPFPVAIVSARRFLKLRREASRMWRLRRFYNRAIQRVSGDWSGSGDTGDAFDDATHAYSRDLDLFGAGSLFELICICRSGVGRRALALYLREAPSHQETAARQEAIQELSQRIDIREQVAVLGPYESSDSRWETFTEWLDSRAVSFPNSVRVILSISSALLALIILVGLLIGGRLVPWALVTQCMGPFLLFHAAVGITVRDRVDTMTGSLGTLSSEIQTVRAGLALLEAQNFQSAKLRRLSDSVRNSATALRKLERRLNALSERNKDWFYLPSKALLIGTQLCISIERWRAEHGSALRGWLEAWGEFEALNALACYAYENPDHVFPEVLQDGAVFEAGGLGHPLLPESTCVRNDVQLNDASRFHVVSGSNMSGKSTLLRAIGLNAVLALSGAPVRARYLRTSRLSVCASLAVADSLLTGKSKFQTEVERLRLALESASGDVPVLFLVDEIFSGTNSRDRRVAAEAVIRTLIDRGAIGVLSTHDLALTEIANDPALHGINIHMGSRGEGDPMDFDYLVKPGVTEETNALAIARLAGVPV